MEEGSLSFEAQIPEGLKLSLVDLAVTDASLLAGAEIEARPARGATGRGRLTVTYKHPRPMGHVAFTLRLYASPEGVPPTVVVPLGESGADKRMRALVEQDAPVDVAVGGPLAEAFYSHLMANGAETIDPSDGFSGAPTRTLFTGAEIAAIVAVSIAVLAATCIALGFATFAAVLFYAMSQGYDIDNAGYTVAVGEGDSRQEHQMAFSLRK